MTSPHDSVRPSWPQPGFGLASMLQRRSITSHFEGKKYRGRLSGMAPDMVFHALESLPYGEEIHVDAPRSLVHGADMDWCCRVLGPVEPRDIDAIASAVQYGQDPLDIDIRADVHLQRIGSDVLYSCWNEDLMYALGGLTLQNHVAEALHRRPEDVPLPDLGVLAIIMAEGGFSVRGIETELFPTFVDIGIAPPDLEAVEASSSVIYDRVTGGWHTD